LNEERVIPLSINHFDEVIDPFGCPVIIKISEYVGSSEHTALKTAEVRIYVFGEMLFQHFI
jgi:hypothetical protein